MTSSASQSVSHTLSANQPQSPLAAEIAAGEGITLARAARCLPGKNGKPCAPTTLARWWMSGVRLPSGDIVRLEALRLGRVAVTSRRAVERFLTRLNGEPFNLDPPATATPSASSDARRREIELARQELREAGA